MTSLATRLKGPPSVINPEHDALLEVTGVPRDASKYELAFTAKSIDAPFLVQSYDLDPPSVPFQSSFSVSDALQTFAKSFFQEPYQVGPEAPLYPRLITVTQTLFVGSEKLTNTSPELLFSSVRPKKDGDRTIHPTHMRFKLSSKTKIHPLSLPYHAIIEPPPIRTPVFREITFTVKLLRKLTSQANNAMTVTISGNSDQVSTSLQLGVDQKSQMSGCIRTASKVLICTFTMPGLKPYQRQFDTSTLQRNYSPEFRVTKAPKGKDIQVTFHQVPVPESIPQPLALETKKVRKPKNAAIGKK